MYHTTAIFGPPGTGKTRYLTNLVADSLPAVASDMAVVSFSRAAARELASRLNAMGHAPKFVGTIHSLCFNTLHLTKSNVALIDNFAASYNLILDATDVKQAVELGALCKRTGLPFDSIFMDTNQITLSPESALYILDLYNKWKKDNWLYDFDDMLYKAKGKLPKFGVVIVDEAQDLSRVQLDLIDSMVKPGGRLYMAGDDDQAIYTWAGADPHGMSQMAKEKVVLEQSYRIPRAVFALAVSTSNLIQQREPKQYMPRDADGKLEFQELYDPYLYPHEHLVLCRDRYVMKEIEEELIFQARPYILHGAYGRGLCKSVYGRAIKAVQDDDPETADRYKHLFIPSVRDILFRGFHNVRWQDIIIMPDYMRNYFERLDPEAKPVTVSTIHAQKGNEADHVVLCTKCSSVVDSLMDIPLFFDNEVRVWYTGITRAKERLTIIGNNQYLGGV